MARRFFSGWSLPLSAPVREGGESFLLNLATDTGKALLYASGWILGGKIGDVLFGPIEDDTDVREDACNIHSKAFQDCVHDLPMSDIIKCQVYFERLKQCRRGPGASTSA